MHRLRASSVRTCARSLVAALVVTGCDGISNETPAEGPTDAEYGADAAGVEGSVDAQSHPGADGASAPDTASPPDATAAPDAAGDANSTAEPDASTQSDAIVGPDAASLPDSPGEPDVAAAPDAISEPDGGAPITILGAGATNGTFNGTDVAVDANGAGTAPIGAISITGGQGSLEIDGEGTVAAFVMAHQPFGNEQLYEVVAVAPDRVTLLWVYCQGGALKAEYWEDSRGQASGASARSGAANATGTCVQHLGAASVPVQLPAFSFPAPPPVSEITITANGLSYDGKNPGILVDRRTTYALYPFHRVDCSACMSTLAPGWQELHSFLVDPVAGTVSIGIIYLFPAAANALPQLSYALTLPTLAEPPDETFRGTWTGPPGTMLRVAPRLRGPLPRAIVSPP
jgi:hypothetical protein